MVIVLVTLFYLPFFLGYSAARIPVYYKVRGSPVGSSSLSTNIPSAPRELTANIVSSRFVTLTWLPPLSTNSPILTYSVYYKEAGSTRERVFNTSAGHLEANIQGLRPSTDYAFRLVAYNQFGPGDSSQEFVVRTNAEGNFRVHFCPFSQLLMSLLLHSGHSRTCQ